MFDIVVVGAGLSGAVMAREFAEQGKKVLVIEKRNHIGGNCYDEKNAYGILVHRYGPHLFHTDNKEVVDYLSRFCEWEPYQHRVLASIDGTKVPLPFSFASIRKLFPETLARKLEEKLLARFSYGQKVPILQLRQSDDSQLRFLAEFIYEKVFLHYTLKQWGITPEEIDPEVTARVPVLVGEDTRYFTDRYQMVPKEGYTRMIANMLHHPKIALMLQTDAKEVLRLMDGAFRLFGRDFAGLVIYTGAIDALFDYRYGRLAYRSLDLVFETLHKERYQDTATVNYPNDYDFTRITEFKHIHKTDSPFTTILKEFPKECRESDEPFYPFFDEANRKIYEKYAALAESIDNLVLVGRLAEYRYYDMDDAVARALEQFQQIKSKYASR